LVSLSSCLLVALALGAASGVAAPVAQSANVEGGSSFSELSEKAQQQAPKTQTTASTATTTSTEPTSNSKSVIVLALVAAVLLLLAIAFVIVRDARKHAPEGDPQLTEAGASHDATVRLRKRRAKAKAARQQRKRNR
jgi:H+/Cl- antiporter ClcA